MRSNIRLLIVTAVVMVILAAAVVILTLGKGEEDTAASESETTASKTLSRLLYEKDPSLISNIHIKNETGEYDVKKYAEDSWFVTDFVGVNHNTSAISDLLNGAACVTSEQTASENAEDMSVYGLDSPRAEVTVTFEDSAATVKKLLIGADSPSAGLTYLSLDGESAVYAVDTSDIDFFLEDRFYYIAKTVYTAKQAEDENDTTDYSKINSITISRKDIDYDIVLEYDERQDSEDIVSGNSSSHIMTSPVRLDLNPDSSYDVLNNVFGLTASEVAVVAPSEEMLERFGLAEPFATIDFDIVGGDLRLLIGDSYVDENTNATGYYCYADGIDIIYMFDSTSVPWATIMPLDITMTMITSTYIYAVDSVDVVTADSSTHFELNKDPDDFAVTCADSDVTSDNFKSFYQFILRAPAEELYLEDTDAKADVTVTISSDYGTDVIEFIPSDDRKSIIKLNGTVSFKCRTAYTARLIENVQNLLDGEKIIDTW